MQRTSTKVPRYVMALYRAFVAEQGQSGLGLEAQAFVETQGWLLVSELRRDKPHGRSPSRLPGGAEPLLPTRSSAGCCAVRLHHAPGAHALAAAGGRHPDPDGGYARG